MEQAQLTKPSFEDSYPEILSIVQSRRSAWTYLSLIEWADVSAILVERVWRKWDQFDPAKGRLENWVNRLVSHAMMNLRRDCLLRLARPCIGGWNGKGKMCVHNLGGDSCSITKSHKQCEECPIYRDWKKAREHQLNIKSTVALDNHAQEVSNIQGDFNDVERIKDEIDVQMKVELTQWEYKVYHCLYIRHLSPTATCGELETLVKTWKRAPRTEEQTTYQAVIQHQRRFKQMMMLILARNGHIDL